MRTGEASSSATRCPGSSSRATRRSPSGPPPPARPPSRRPRGRRGPIGRDVRRADPVDPRRPASRGLLGEAGAGLRDEVPGHRLAGHLPRPAWRRRGRPACRRGRRVRPRAQSDVERRLRRLRQRRWPAAPAVLRDPLPQRQPAPGAPRLRLPRRPPRPALDRLAGPRDHGRGLTRASIARAPAAPTSPARRTIACRAPGARRRLFSRSLGSRPTGASPTSSARSTAPSTSS